jgi:hypothetical protein
MTTETLDRDVRLFVIEHFVETARPPTVAETAEALGIAQVDSTAAYDRLASNRILVLEPGTHEIRMANPLSAVPTAFPVSVGGKHYFGSCIWDALGTVAMLGGTGTVESSCACCGEALPLEIHNLELQPVDGVVHFAVPAAHWWDDIVYS